MKCDETAHYKECKTKLYVIYLLPVALSVVQILMMLTVFKHDTPVMLKKSGDYQQLRVFMNKIYPNELVDAMIREIGSDAEEGDGN